MVVFQVLVEMALDVSLILLSKENNDKEIILWTSSGALKSQILGNNLVETEIGIPKTNWNEIPLSKNLDTKNLNIKIVG